MTGTPLFDTPLFDTHCHLDFPCFDGKRASLLDSCRRQGVSEILVPGVESTTWERLLSVCDSDSGVHAALGLHPGFMKRHREDDLETLSHLLEQRPVVAVGEIGLDFWDGRQEADAQKALFEEQLRIAAAFGLPVLLHVRKAHDEVLQLLRLYRLERGGVVHAFSGSYQQAEQYVGLGFKIGIGGAVTYPRARRLRRSVAELPLESLVLETDAPDMPLCGRQGQANRPDYLPETFAVLAGLREEDSERVRRQLWRNSLALLGRSVPG